jgi:tetratricopeptide (TPR) repeat protein
MANNPVGIAYSKGSISMCCQFEGKMNPAYEFAKETLTLAQETDDAYIKAMAYSCYGTTCYHKGLFDVAKSHLLEFISSYEKTASIACVAWAYGHLGSMHLDLSEYDDADRCYNKIISTLANYRILPSMIKLFQSCLVRAKALRRDQDIEVSELFASYQSNKLTFCEGWMARNIGDILLNIDNNHLADAGSWFQKAIEADTKNGYRWHLAMDHACYADWFKKKGDIQGAKEQLTKAIDIFKECGADGWVTRMEKTLAEIS